MRQEWMITRLLGALLTLVISCQGSKGNGGGGNGKNSANAAGVSSKFFDSDEFSCAKRTKTSNKLALLAEDAPSWDGEIKSLMQNKCVSCHGRNATPPDLTTYQSTAKEGEENLERMMRTGAGVMPPAGQLPAKELALFKAWFDQGMPEKAASTGGSEEDDKDQNEDKDDDDDAETEDETGDEEDADENKDTVIYDEKLCPNAAKAND